MLFVVTIHWISVRLYSNYCVPQGFLGYIYTYITISSPPCKALLYIQTTTSDYYFSIWSGISISIISYLSTLLKTTSASWPGGSIKIQENKDI